MKNDEFDAATVERCAQVAERWLESSWRDEVFAAKSIASAIRSLIQNSARDARTTHLQGEGEPVVKQAPSPAGTVGEEELARFLNPNAFKLAEAGTIYGRQQVNLANGVARALLSQFDVRRK